MSMVADASSEPRPAIDLCGFDARRRRSDAKVTDHEVVRVLVRRVGGSVPAQSYGQAEFAP